MKSIDIYYYWILEYKPLLYYPSGFGIVVVVFISYVVYDILIEIYSHERE